MYSFLKIVWVDAKMLILWLGKRLLLLNRLAVLNALCMVELHAVQVSDVGVGSLFFKWLCMVLHDTSKLSFPK